MSNESSICLFCSIAIFASTAAAAPIVPACFVNFFDAKYPPIAPTAAPIPAPIVAPMPAVITARGPPTAPRAPPIIPPIPAPAAAPPRADAPIPTFCIVFCPASFVIGSAPLTLSTLLCMVLEF